MIPKISGSEVKSFVKASKELKLADATSSMQERVDSYISSKAPLSLPKVAKPEEIIPENSINFLA